MMLCSQARGDAMTRPVVGWAGLFLVGVTLAGCQNDNNYRRRSPLPDSTASRPATTNGNNTQTAAANNPTNTGVPTGLAANTTTGGAGMPTTPGMPTAPGMATETNAGLSPVTGRPTMNANTMGAAPTYGSNTPPYPGGGTASGPGASSAGWPIQSPGAMPAAFNSPGSGTPSLDMRPPADPGAFSNGGMPSPGGMGGPNTAKKPDDMDRARQWDELRTPAPPEPAYPSSGSNGYTTGVPTRQPGDLPE